MASKRVLITGASGLLGRAVLSTMRNSGWSVLGTAYTRTGENLVKLDICDPEQVEKVVEEFKPSAIVHCAAQRFPDKVEKDLEGTMKLNVEATGKMAVLAAERGITMLYISTDYVFDGTKPPYAESDLPNPLNTYGETKLKGEVETLKASSGHIVLRIPILFGTVEYLGESAVTCLLELLFNKAIKSVSDYEIRYPSHGCDIAVICSKLLELKMEGKPIQGIYHWGGKDSLTKYGMVCCIAEVFDLSMKHILPDQNPSPGAPRPYNAQLATARIDDLGIGQHTSFREAIKSALAPWVQRFQSDST